MPQTDTLKDNQHLLCCLFYHERNEDLDIQTFNGIYDYADLSWCIFFVRCAQMMLLLLSFRSLRRLF